jgi:signal transduction histidine kinase
MGIYGVFYTINSFYKLNKRQNNFLLSVTHEFKTPIAAIRLMLQTAKNPKVKDEKKAELVDNSIQNTFRLEELAENMLTAMQIENNRYTYNKIDVDLSFMLNHIAKNQSVKGELNAKIQEGVTMLGDEFILRMAFNNLIENAFKYSNDGPVDLELKAGDGKIQVIVKDQGIGISRKDYKNIFKKFYRVQDDETRTTKGTGLGLFIVKQTMEKHNGRITVTANEPRGSVFTITFS